MKTYYIVCLLLIVSLPTWGQDAAQRLTQWSQKNPIEKAYLHTDRTSYYSGQTIWFKSYLLSDMLPAIKSTTLYVELLNEQQQILQRKILPNYIGSSNGQLELPDALPSGTYLLRAYTPHMLNQPGFEYVQSVIVYGKETIKKNTPAAPKKSVNISFFPEGGNMITKLLNVVAFKAIDENGWPVSVSGTIQSGSGSLIANVQTLHDGMGTFTIIPQPQDNYYFIPNTDSTVKYPLPTATTRGVVFSIRDTDKGKYFTLHQLPDDENFKAAYMIGQMQHNILFRQAFTTTKEMYGGTIQTHDMPSGILHITVFNKAGMPLAQRLTFINNKEYILPASFTVDTVNNLPRQRNHFSIALKDTIIGSFSMSVTDADFEESSSRPQNIYSAFLLTGDIRGYVHQPAYYFTSTEAAREAELVMMTNGWTRFKWTDAIANTLPPASFTDPGYIHLNGKVVLEGTKKPFADKDLMVLIKPTDSTLRGAMQIIHTDSAGNFAIDSAIFYDENTILFSDVKGRKSKFIKVRMNSDSLNRSYTIAPTAFPTFYTEKNNTLIENKMQQQYDAFIKAEGKLLSGVTVRGRIKSQTQQLDDMYTSSLFSGGIDSRTLDLRNETSGLTIFEYLQGRLPGLFIRRGDDGSYQLNYRNTSFDDKGNVTLFLDEMRTDPNFMEGIPVSQIAYVKLMPNFVGNFGGGTSLAIYMKKGAELAAATDAATDIIKYKGYSIIKEFYQPNYSVKKPEHDKEDNRLTLYWNPYVYLTHIDPKIPISFYNSDSTKKFKVVIEGITQNGQLLHIEQTIDPNKP